MSKFGSTVWFRATAVSSTYSLRKKAGGGEKKKKKNNERTGSQGSKRGFILTSKSWTASRLLVICLKRLRLLTLQKQLINTYKADCLQVVLWWLLRWAFNIHSHILQTHFAALRVAVWYHEIRSSRGTTDCTKMIHFTKRLVCFGLPPLPGVEEKLFLNPAKRRLHLTSCVCFDIFRKAEEITTP